MTAVAIQHRDLIINRLSRGDFLHDIADSVGINDTNISKHLADDPDYKSAREIGIARRLAKASQAIESIAETGSLIDVESGREVIVGIDKAKGNLARVRESHLRSVQWHAEREFPHIYGEKKQINVTGTITLDMLLSEAEERPIDGEAERITGDGPT